jgi:hypothetical protein
MVLGFYSKISLVALRRKPKPNKSATLQFHPMTAKIGPSKELNSLEISWPVKVSTITYYFVHLTLIKCYR